jgi:hypothetical protein
VVVVPSWRKSFEGIAVRGRGMEEGTPMEGTAGVEMPAYGMRQERSRRVERLRGAFHRLL